MFKAKVYLLALTLTTCYCTSTRIAKSWKDPDASVSLESLNKVLVVALLKDETSRRVVEDELLSRLNGKGVASYSYFKDEVKDLKEDDVKEKLRNDDFDGAVIMRLVDVDKEVNYTPGTFSTYPVYFRTVGGYLVRSWNYYSTPDRYATTKTFTVETSVYSVKQDKILWTGITETSNPSKVDKMTDEIAKAVYKQMVKENFIRQGS